MLLPIKKIKELYKEYEITNKSLTVIANENNISRVYLRELFIKHCGYKKAIKKSFKYTKLVDDDIVDEYYNEYVKTGISQSKFAKEKGICRQVLSEKFKKKYPEIETLKLNTNKLSINSNSFSIINKDSAYWLGIMLTDGYIDKKYYSFELCLKDKEHIEKFKTFLQSEHKINHKIININNKKCEAWRITVKDNNICNDLKNLNCTNNKSFNVRLPKIDNKYYSDLIRGIFDGDGCISSNGNVGFCSANKNFVQDIINILNKNDILTGKITHSRNLYSVRISTKNNNLNKFFDFLYKDSNESNRLNRKYDKFLGLLPSQDKTVRNPESISAELSEDGVKSKDSLLESEGAEKLANSNVSDDSNIDQAQRIDSDPLPYE